MATLMMVFALVAQPLYGFVSAQIANAATQDQILINEVKPATGSNGEKWVELYNPSNQQKNLNKWRIMRGSAILGNVLSAPDATIESKGYLVVSISESLPLNSNGSPVELWSNTKGSDGTLIDSIDYSSLVEGRSYARTYDAAATWAAQSTPTKGVTNGSVSITPIIVVPTPQLNGENFNTHSGDDYKGFNVGFNAKDFGTVSSVTVDLYQGNTKLVTNTGTAALNTLITNGEYHLSTPFYVQGGASDSFWTFGSRSWISADKPTKAVVSIVGSNGSKEVSVSSLAEPNGWTFESLLPPAPLVDVVAPTITNLKVTNPTLWGDSYNIAASANHNSTLTGLPTVGGSVKVGADFADNMVLTNVMALLPGRGFFADNEFTPFPTNNASWNPVAQGLYSVAWNTKAGADWRSVADGNYSFTFQARDGGNGQNRPQNSTSVPIELTVDNTAPGASFSGATPVENATVKGDIVVEGNFTDANGLMNTDIGVHAVAWYCHTDWPAVGAKSCTIDTTKLTDGAHQLTMSARDKAGNTSQVFRTIKVDNSSPSVPVASAPHNTYELDNDFYFTWTNSTDALSLPVTYEFQSSLDSTQVNGILTTGIWKSGILSEAKIHSTGAPDGTWYWQVRAIDAVGNVSAWSAIWNMTIDHVGPVSSLTSPADNAIVNGATLTQVWSSASTDVKKYIYESYNDSAMAQVRFTQDMGLQTSKTAVNVGNATFWWRVKAIDNAGHATWSELRKLTVDNDKPTAQLQFSAIGDKNFKVKFNENVNKDDAENVASYFLHNWPGGGTFDGLMGYAVATYDSNTTTATVSFTDANWHLSPEQKWGVRNVRDLAGNVLDETSDHSTPMTKSTISGINGIVTGKSIVWTWTGVDPDSTHTAGATGNSGIKGYRYQLTQGSTLVQDWTSASSATATTNVVNDGSYELKVEAQDNAGNNSDTVTSASIIVDTAAPVLTLGTPVQNVDGTYRISGTTTDSDIPVTVKLNGDIIASQVLADEDGIWIVGLGALIAGTTYVVTADSTDAAGNTSEQQQSRYDTPAVQTSIISTIATIAVLPGLNLPTPLSQARSTAFAGGSLAAQTTQQESVAQNAAILGTQDKAETPLASTSVIAPSSQGWKIFSMAWYWWLLIIIAAMAAWMQIAAGIRRIRGADDL